MLESDIIKQTNSGPITVSRLKNEFKKIGVKSGMTLLVHSSLSSMGWVCGGAVAVILALEKSLTESGTLVMPAHSGDLSDPANWQHPPVPDSWCQTIRETMPAFETDLTPTRNMGAIAECFRKQNNTLRSDHPNCSFTARGLFAQKIIQEHTLDFEFGENSPLSRLYELDAWVLLLGVSHNRNSSLHLSENRAKFPEKKIIKCSAPILVNGIREWCSYDRFNYDESDFDQIGQNFRKDNPTKIHIGTIGNAVVKLFSQRLLVDYAVEWMNKYRKKWIKKSMLSSDYRIAR